VRADDVNASSAMKLAYSALALALLAGCATPQRSIVPGMSETEVVSRFGKPVSSGQLPTGAAYHDYTAQPFGFTITRVTFTPDGRVQDARNLLTEENFNNLQVGMTPEQVIGVVGPVPQFEQRVYAGGTKSWRYRYRNYDVIKLLNVIYGPDNRLLTWWTEWDPEVYSDRGDGKGSSGK
jgi:hypothetical protein